MKNFQESPMNKGDELEESTWTSYFEEFLCQNDQDMIMSYNETLNSLAPDATSSEIVTKVAYFQDDQANKMGFKKRKIKAVVFDDSLEDTATSPLSSPKEKVGACEEQNKRMVGSNMELKKRGLCLVPLSSLSRYLS